MKYGVRSMKRCFDVWIPAIVLALFFPVLAVVAMAIRLNLGSPIFFRQTRPGLNEKPFTMLKFRTMRDAFDSEGRPLPDAERLTPLGRFLRATSLDELPELWNVLKGDMSLVGPRPLLPQYLDRYTAFERRRHEVKPGLTGWAQIGGRNSLTWHDKFKLDVWYVDNWSLSLDLKILLRTVSTVLRRDGIAQQGHATMPEFMGSAE
jgi:lipopolysaccharide/colanic/teichoic acid biosynthesis glycosyltransferase